MGDVATKPPAALDPYLPGTEINYAALMAKRLQTLSAAQRQCFLNGPYHDVALLKDSAALYLTHFPKPTNVGVEKLPAIFLLFLTTTFAYSSNCCLFPRMAKIRQSMICKSLRFNIAAPTFSATFY